MSTHTQKAIALRIYNTVINELALPHHAAAQLGITLQRIQLSLDECVNKGLTVKQAEDIIIKIWRQSYLDSLSRETI